MDSFWLFLVIVLSVLPITMIMFGSIYKKFAPGYNYMFGYKTKRSLKSRESWEFAHIYFGKFWFVAGIVLVGLNIIVMLAVSNTDHELIGMMAIAVAGFELVVFVLSVVFTEHALKRTFDNDGNTR